MKERILALIGATAAALGGVGAFSCGLSACGLAPVISLAGIGVVSISFLSEQKIFFLAAGIILIILSVCIHKNNKSCRV
ncbi:hypothetical protein KY310_02475 [Candidatus Woesearchaeota archaeon]|nr:hypothetical protein [Candidatus Woesearchaeota archaeon]